MRRLLVAGSLACAVLAVLAVSATARMQVRKAISRTTAYPAWRLARPETVRFRPNERVLRPALDRGGRVYLFAALNNGAEMWREPLYRPLVDRLLAGGSEVVLMDSPPTKPRFFDDKGEHYCRALVAWIDSTDRRLDAQRPARHKTLVGISFGGFQAMMGAARLPWAKTFVAMSPVTHLYALDEYWFVSNAKCNPFTETAKLHTKAGLVTYGTAEARVNSDYLAAIADQAAARKIVYPNRQHVTVGDEYAPAVAWIGQSFGI